MKNKVWYGIWCGLFILCAILGFIPEPAGLVKGLLVLAAVAFFVPGWVLLYRADRHKDAAHAKAVSAISGCSLGMTLLLLVLNFLSGKASEAAGRVVYGFLVIFSSPMICSQYWVLSLFLWACLLMTGLSLFKKLKKQLS